jgi:putative FmdB family regulatory protein
MPLIEFKCHDCGRQFIIRTSAEDLKSVKATCPQCRGERISRVISYYRSINSTCECDFDYESCEAVSEAGKSESS